MVVAATPVTWISAASRVSFAIRSIVAVFTAASGVPIAVTVAEPSLLVLLLPSRLNSACAIQPAEFPDESLAATAAVTNRVLFAGSTITVVAAGVPFVASDTGVASVVVRLTGWPMT